MRQLILRDSEWLRGELSWEDGENESKLYRTEDRRMCCLGLDALACGVPREILEDQATPLQVGREIKEECPLPDALAYVARWVYSSFGEYEIHSQDATDLMTINDDRDFSDEERIEEMRPIFAKHGIELVFLPNE